MFFNKYISLCLLTFFIYSNFFTLDQGSGIIPYCEKEGKLFLLFALDLYREENYLGKLTERELWGDFGGEKIDGYPLERSAAMYAHQGTMGVFSEIYKKPHDLQLYKDGVKFFLNKINFSKIINFKNTVFEYTIFFIKVDYCPANFFMYAYGNDWNTIMRRGLSFIRRVGFAWIDLEQLLSNNLTNNNNLKLFSQDHESIFSYQQRSEIVLNKYISEIFKTEEAIKVLKKL